MGGTGAFSGGGWNCVAALRAADNIGTRVAASTSLNNVLARIACCIASAARCVAGFGAALRACCACVTRSAMHIWRASAAYRRSAPTQRITFPARALSPLPLPFSLITSLKRRALRAGWLRYACIRCCFFSPAAAEGFWLSLTAYLRRCWRVRCVRPRARAFAQHYETSYQRRCATSTSFRRRDRYSSLWHGAQANAWHAGVPRLSSPPWRLRDALLQRGMRAFSTASRCEQALRTIDNARRKQAYLSKYAA